MKPSFRSANSILMSRLTCDLRFFFYPLIHNPLRLESHVLMILVLISVKILYLLILFVLMRLLQKTWLI
jgi:hypothetical protein